MSRLRVDASVSVNHERWLVSYADFITLLFAFFVVMYSISQVNEEKQRILSQALLGVFAQPEKSLKPIHVGDPILVAQKSAIELTSTELENGLGNFLRQSDLPSANSQVNSGPVLDTSYDNDFATLENQLKNRFSELVDDQQLHFRHTQHWLEIELKTAKFFQSGSAEPNYAAETVFDEIGSALANIENAIQVEGHTDNTPVSTALYPSNWELSTARAATVVQIFAQNNVNERRLTAVGHGAFKPLVDNNSSTNRALNRRIVIKVEKQVSDVNRDDRRALREFREQKNQILASSSLSALEKNQALIDLGPSPENPSLIEILDLLADSPSESNSSSISQTPSSNSIDNNNSSVAPVILDNGNLLFSSEPELPRQQ